MNKFGDQILTVPSLLAVATSLPSGDKATAKIITPQHNQFTPRRGRVMLYAYWPAGTVEWDEVVVKQITPAPAPPR